MAKKFSKDVKFGNLAVGESTARLGFHVPRSDLELEEADALFAGSRCTAMIEMREDPGQTTITVAGKDISKIEPIDAVVDIKRYGVSNEMFTAGMTLQMSEIDVSKLARFANKAGKLTLKRTGAIPDAVKEEAETLGGDDPAFDEGTEPARRSKNRE